MTVRDKNVSRAIASPKLQCSHTLWMQCMKCSGSRRGVDSLQLKKFSSRKTTSKKKMATLIWIDHNTDRFETFDLKLFN